MSRARCVFQVRGLDCASEVAALRGALEGWPGVTGLGCDLIHGLMTVDYDAGALDPAALAGRVAERAGLRAELVGSAVVEEPGWWKRHGRWLATAVSGLALAVGVAVDYAGGPVPLVRLAYLTAIAAGAAELVPKAIRAVRGRRID